MSKIIVNISHVVYHYGAEIVLDDVSWEIQAGQKIGLVGPNGAGKSTLLRLVKGELWPDSGSVTRYKGIRIGYLAQAPRLDEESTVWDEVLGANPELRQIETEMRRLEARMADPHVCNDERAFARVLKAHTRAQERFEQREGYRYESRCQWALQAVGFKQRDFDLAVSALSGGQRKMLGLAKLLVLQPDMLLLDEPDNHLDLEGKASMEAFIREFAGTVIIVSHDRYLLDETVSLIAEVEDHGLTVYAGNYSMYAIEKERRLLRQQQLYEAQQKEIVRIEAAIARFEKWAHEVVNERHARQARSRRKMLERMDKIDEPILERRQMGLALNGWRGSNKVLEIVDLDKVFPAFKGKPSGKQKEASRKVNRIKGGGDENIVLLGLNMIIWHGERVGLLGPNGAGKSVLFRCILGQEVPTGGVIKIGPSVQIGYYAQQHETLDPDRTLIQEIWDAKSMSEQNAVSVLQRFLFPYRRARDRVRQLSGGERSRLQLAKLMLSGANFLLLDEPTNNLDIPSAEVLEEALADFEGTVLVISHDRYFLDRVVDRVVDLEDGALTQYLGNYTYYAEKKGEVERVK
jgi:ATP-binding cassette subfamily F protein 3